MGIETYDIENTEGAIDKEKPELVKDPHEYINVLRRHIRDNPKKALMLRHRLWMESVQH